MFRESVDTDTKRKEITWIAILCLAVLAFWQILASYLGQSVDFTPRSYEEKVLFGGMGAVLLCAVLYIAVREREQRHANQRLLKDLNGAVAALSERLRQLRTLCVTSADLVGTLDAEHTCQLAVDALAVQLRGARCILTLTTQRHGTLTFTAGSPLPATDSERAQSVTCQEISAALQVADETLGRVVAIRQAGEDGFSPEETSILLTMANMTSKALESARLHQDLQQSYLSTLGALMNLLGARDNYAAAHARRVSSLAVRFGQHLGLSEDLLAVLEEYGLLHDLGKIGIPDEVLLKSGPLTVSERTLCEQHTIVGEQILRPLHPSSDALAVVRSHHERWDGAGYPDGLAGESIPLLARLIHIVDAYDAILSARPYSEKRDSDWALSEIQFESGSQFDPELVAAFVRLVREESSVGAVPSDLQHSAR